MIRYIIPSALVATLVASCSTAKQSKTKEKTVAVAGKKVQGGEKTIDVAYLDKGVRPQDDFFMFANGTWVKNNPVPPSESRWGSFNELEKQNQVKLTGLLEGAKAGTSAEGSNEAMLGNYYASFMNMDQRNKQSWNGIKQEIFRINGMASPKEVVYIVADQHKNGINSLFGMGVGQDLKQVDRNIMYFGQSGIGLPNKEYYLESSKADILDAYHKHIVKMFTMIGYSEENSKVAAKEIIKFETKLAEKMMAPAELRIPEKSYNKKTTPEFTAMMPAFNLEEYRKTVGMPEFREIIVGQPDFAAGISDLIANTDISTWKNYLTWKTLNHYAEHLDEKFEKEHFDFYQGVLTGKSQMKPMNERAINEITQLSIGEALGKLFVDKYYSQRAQERVNSMVDNLLATFEERIKALPWMSAETKKEALTKLKSIGRKLGFPSKWEDFSDLRLTREDYIGNIRQISQRDVRKNFEELSKPVDKEKWGMPAHLINAYYHPLLNEIAFPAGIMQAPFFDVDAEDAVNYGRIGMVIGHEFTHGFDDMGSKFAADGSFTNWWTADDRKLFEERTALLGQTFAGFCPIDGHCVNPDLTMGENIADLGGITLAYYAYTKTDEFKSGEVKEGFTPAQRFFLSFAQLWKINYTEAELKNRIANDPHSPGMYRVNGPLMNCPEFFAAFNVKEGDKMRNSAAKVAKIW